MGAACCRGAPRCARARAVGGCRRRGRAAAAGIQFTCLTSTHEDNNTKTDTWRRRQWDNAAAAAALQEQALRVMATSLLEVHPQLACHVAKVLLLLLLTSTKVLALGAAAAYSY